MMRMHYRHDYPQNRNVLKSGAARFILNLEQDIVITIPANSYALVY
jgi:hypothetical protein